MDYLISIIPQANTDYSTFCLFCQTLAVKIIKLFLNLFYLLRTPTLYVAFVFAEVLDILI